MYIANDLPKKSAITNQWRALKQWLSKSGDHIARQVRPFIKPQLVYMDYDVVCMRASNGVDILFQLHPELNLDQFITAFDLKRYLSHYSLPCNQSSLLVITTKADLESGCADDNAGVIGMRQTMDKWANYFGISTIEMLLIGDAAAREFLVGFSERRRMSATHKIRNTKARKMSCV